MRRERLHDRDPRCHRERELPAAGLHVASTSLGDVLVDSAGRTVYMLTADSPGHSSCSSACLAYWPPVAPASHTSTVTAKVATTTTPSGAKIATAGGWPLYTFVQDQKPGDVTGEGVATFGGIWYAVSPSGQPVTGSASSPSSSPWCPRAAATEIRGGPPVDGRLGGP